MAFLHMLVEKAHCLHIYVVRYFSYCNIFGHCVETLCENRTNDLYLRWAQKPRLLDDWAEGVGELAYDGTTQKQQCLVK